MKVKAIMCDVDGTLLTSKGVVSPLTIQAIQKAREKRYSLWFINWKRCPQCQNTT